MKVSIIEPNLNSSHFHGRRLSVMGDPEYEIMYNWRTILAKLPMSESFQGVCKGKWLESAANALCGSECLSEVLALTHLKRAASALRSPHIAQAARDYRSCTIPSTGNILAVLFHIDLLGALKGGGRRQGWT